MTRAPQIRADFSALTCRARVIRVTSRGVFKIDLRR